MFLTFDDAGFVLLRSSRTADLWRLIVSNPARSALRRPRFSAYSLPSIGPTCGGSLSRYGRPIPNSLPCASIHFHKLSLEMHRCARVSPFTLTRDLTPRSVMRIPKPGTCRSYTSRRPDFGGLSLETVRVLSIIAPSRGCGGVADRRGRRSDDAQHRSEEHTSE